METILIEERKKSVAVPEPTVRRLPTYLNIAKNLLENGEMHVSAPALARILKIDPTQVTKDLSYTTATGKTRVGYQLDELIVSIEDFLGYNRNNEAFLVGAGHLGNALIQYQGFRDSGMRIVAAFDTDKKKIGHEIAGVPVFDLEKFRDLAGRLHITIGIITTPPSAAQNIADLMVGWGIKAIWNFAPVSLIVPEHIIVQDTHIYANLAVILNRLHNSDTK
jgi:redox-sensing transcriptional repressor